jgi:hypothetical protein
MLSDNKIHRETLTKNIAEIEEAREEKLDPISSQKMILHLIEKNSTFTFSGIRWIYLTHISMMDVKIGYIENLKILRAALLSKTNIQKHGM